MAEVRTHTPSFQQLQLDEEPVVRDNERLSSYAGVHRLDLDAKPKSGGSTPTDKGSMAKKTQTLTIALIVGALAAGTLTGFGLHTVQSRTGSDSAGTGDLVSQVATSNVKNGDIFGVPDAETFKDSAEGFLEEGGLQGEGSHHLLRPGGETQTVYLTSSVTDLDKFKGMQVKVWGETFKAQKAGWLMDVGRVQVVNTQGERPSEE